MISHKLNKVCLRSREDVSDNHEEDDDVTNVHDFVENNSFVAIPAAQSSFDTVWFMKVTNVNSIGESLDDCGNNFSGHYMSGHFLEKKDDLKSKQTFSLQQNRIFLQREHL